MAARDVPHVPRPTPGGGTPRPPTDAPVQAFKPLPEGATIEQLCHAQNEMAAAYASVAVALTSEIPAIRKLLEEDRAIREADRVERKRIDEKLDELALGLGALETRVHSLEHPANDVTADGVVINGGRRATDRITISPSKSSHDLAKHVSQETLKDIEHYEKSESTPPGPASKEVMGQIFEQRVASAIASREAARLAQVLDDQRLAGLADAVTTRQIRVLKWTTGLSIIAGIVATLVAHFAH